MSEITDHIDQLVEKEIEKRSVSAYHETARLAKILENRTTDLRFAEQELQDTKCELDKANDQLESIQDGSEYVTKCEKEITALNGIIEGNEDRIDELEDEVNDLNDDVTEAQKERTFWVKKARLYNDQYHRIYSLLGNRNACREVTDNHALEERIKELEEKLAISKRTVEQWVNIAGSNMEDLQEARKQVPDREYKLVNELEACKKAIRYWVEIAASNEVMAGEGIVLQERVKELEEKLEFYKRTMDYIALLEDSLQEARKQVPDREGVNLLVAKLAKAKGTIELWKGTANAMGEEMSALRKQIPSKEIQENHARNLRYCDAATTWAGNWSKRMLLNWDKEEVKQVVQRMYDAYHTVDGTYPWEDEECMC